MAVGGEVGYLAVRVACYVLQGGIACGALVEALYWHDGEHLVDGPRVGEALEQREIAEVLVGEQLVNLHQLLWDVLQVFGQRVDLVAHAPVHGLYLRPCLQINNAVGEEVEHLLAYLLGVVPVFEHVARRQVIPYLIKVFYQLMGFLIGFELLRHLGQRGRLEHVDDEHRVVGCQ